MTLSKSLPIALPIIYFTLFMVTLVSGEKTASNGNPFVCVSLPWSLPLMATDNTAPFVIVGVLATAWWYFIGYIGGTAGTNKLTRTGAILGAGLIGLICIGEGALMTSEFLSIAREPNFGPIDSVVYTLAVALLLGGLVSAARAAISGVRGG